MFIQLLYNAIYYYAVIVMIPFPIVFQFLLWIEYLLLFRSFWSNPGHISFIVFLLPRTRGSTALSHDNSGGNEDKHASFITQSFNCLLAGIFVWCETISDSGMFCMRQIRSQSSWVLVPEQKIRSGSYSSKKILRLRMLRIA